MITDKYFFLYFKIGLLTIGITALDISYTLAIADLLTLLQGDADQTMLNKIFKTPNYILSILLLLVIISRFFMNDLCYTKLNKLIYVSYQDRIITSLYERLHSYDVAEIFNERGRAVKNYTTDVNIYIGGYVGPMINLFIDCSVMICLFAYLTFMFELNLQVFLILIATIFIFLIITRRLSKHVKRLGIERNQAENLKTNLLTELSGNWRSLIDLDAIDFFIKDLGKKNKDYSEASVGISRFINFSKIFVETYFGILLALISLFLMGFGELSPAATSAAVVFVLRFLPSVNRSAQSIMAINSSTGALNSLNDNFVKDIVSYRIQLKESEKFISINSFEISSFKRILVSGKNLSITKNILNLIRAPSGTGKSLFLQNLYKKMKKDGVKIAYVPQDAELFSGSILENIYLQRNIELEKINEAKKLLKLLHFPKHKLDEILDPSFDAKNLSGGERQRILLARYYVADLDYLFFDEITSALDPEAETEIFDLLEIMSNGTTIVMNTHTSRPNSSNNVEIDFKNIIS